MVNFRADDDWMSMFSLLEIYSLCNFAHTCDEFIDDDDPSICYMPRQLSEETFPKVVPGGFVSFIPGGFVSFIPGGFVSFI